MKKSNKYDDLSDWLQNQYENAETYVTSKVQPARDQALREYYRKPYKDDDELKGRSTIIMSDVMEAVEWTASQIIKMFVASGKIVRFDPRNAESVDSAKQRTDAVNYVFLVKNDGVAFLIEAIRTILMQGECPASWAVDQNTKKQEKQYQGLTQQEVEGLSQDQEAKVTIENMSEGVDEFGMAVPLYDVLVEQEVSDPSLELEAHDPSMLIIAEGWKSPMLEKCPYICLKRWQSLSDLKEMGIEVDPHDIDDDQQRNDQSQIGPDAERKNIEGTGDANLSTWVKYEWALYDKNKDGLAERIQSIRVKENVYLCEEVDTVDVCQGLAVRVPGTPYGQSEKDLQGSQQELHTSLMRIILDSASFQVEPRIKVLCDSEGNPLADMNSVLDHRSSNPIYEYQLDAVNLMQQAWIGAELLPLLDYVRSSGEMASGSVKTFQGKDKDALNKTATGATIEDESQRTRTDLKALEIAETFVKPVMMGISRALESGELGTLSMEVDGKYVQIDPTQWNDESDMKCEVGLGTGDTNQKKMAFGQIAADHSQIVATGGLNQAVSPKGMFNAKKRLLELDNIHDAASFYIEPGGEEEQEIQARMKAEQEAAGPPPPDPFIQVEQDKINQKREQDAIKADEAEKQRQFDIASKIRDQEFAAFLQDAKEDAATNRKAMELMVKEQAEQRQLIMQLAQQDTDGQRGDQPGQSGGASNGSGSVQSGNSGNQGGSVQPVSGGQD